MLQNQPSAGLQKPAAENGLGNRIATDDVVGRVGKYQVELLGTAFQIEKGIGLDGMNPVETEIPGSSPDEVVMHRVDFDRNDRSGPPRGKLVADRAGPGKQVEHVGAFDVAVALDHIEQIFLGEVGRRTGPQIFRRLYDPAAKDAANDSHNTFGLRTHTGTNLPYVRPSREARA